LSIKNEKFLQRLNLLPHITIYDEDGTSLKLDEKANPIGVLEKEVDQEDFLMGASAQQEIYYKEEKKLRHLCYMVVIILIYLNMVSTT
jgi:hypothetical protein